MEHHTDEVREPVRPATEAERREARVAIAALARPRMTGSPGAAEVEAELRGRLEALGYQIRPLPFEFSTWPGRFGVPAAGGLYLAGTAAATVLLLLGRPAAAVAVLLATLAALGGLALSIPAAIRRLPRGRVRTANWLVHRPDARPRYLVMAHRDSKSQAVSTFLRTAAIGTALLAWVALLTLAALATLQPAWRWPALVGAAAALAALGGGVLLRARAENASPGALDNATGLAALLGIARREREHADIAFLVTDAEELGLAGADAVARQLPRGIEVINLDGLDDDGDFHVVERFGRPRRGLAPHLAAPLLKAATALGLPCVRRDLPLGVLVDHIPLVRAGHPALTLMRGTIGSLRRIHRPEDRVERLTGRGAAAAVALVSGALALLRRGGAAPR